MFTFSRLFLWLITGLAVLSTVADGIFPIFPLESLTRTRESYSGGVMIRIGTFWATKQWRKPFMLIY